MQTVGSTPVLTWRRDACQGQTIMPAYPQRNHLHSAHQRFQQRSPALAAPVPVFLAACASGAKRFPRPGLFRAIFHLLLIKIPRHPHPALFLLPERRMVPPSSANQWRICCLLLPPAAEGIRFDSIFSRNECRRQVRSCSASPRCRPGSLPWTREKKINRSETSVSTT
jgi:hypothetical protein